MAGKEPGFGENTLIFTSQGYMKASEIAPGDFVIGSDGSLHEVVSSSEHEDKLYSIQAYSTVSFEATASTKLLVRLRDRYATRDSRPEYQVMTIKELMKEEKEKPLYKKYLVALPIALKNEYPEWSGVYIKRAYDPMLEKTLDVYDDRLWYLVGLFLKSGNISKNCRNGDLALPYISITITVPLGIAAEISARIPEYLNCSVKEQYSKNNDRISIGNAELAMFMSAFGNKRNEKSVPAAVYNLPSSACRAIIAGFFRASDSELSEFRGKDRRCRMTVTNPGLAMSLSYIVMKGFGIPCCVNRVKANRTRSIGDRTFTMGDFYNVDFYLLPLRSHHEIFEGGYFWYPIRNIEKSGNGKSISLDIDGDESIISAGMTLIQGK